MTTVKHYAFSMRATRRPVTPLLRCDPRMGATTLRGPWATVLGFGVAYDRKNRTVSVNAAKLILDACDKFGLEG